MQQVRLRGEVTESGDLVVDLPPDWPPGAVEVLLQQAATEPNAVDAPAQHPAFGMWRDRPEVADPVAFAAALRSTLEARADARGPKHSAA